MRRPAARQSGDDDRVRGGQRRERGQHRPPARRPPRTSSRSARRRTTGQTGTDGCAIPATRARTTRWTSSTSPRAARASDGRKKPDIMAPGTHIQGAASRSLNYNGAASATSTGPPGQTLYAWSSGTSHSTPAIAGARALVRQDFINQGLAAPSPAMIKAYLMTSTRYMTGVGANDTLWSNTQGMGLVDLGRAFDGVSRASGRPDPGSSGRPARPTSSPGRSCPSASPFRVATRLDRPARPDHRQRVREQPRPPGHRQRHDLPRERVHRREFGRPAAPPTRGTTPSSCSSRPARRARSR